MRGLAQRTELSRTVTASERSAETSAAEQADDIFGSVCVCEHACKNARMYRLVVHEECM